jgi:valyl-tRNA synthetase
MYAPSPKAESYDAALLADFDIAMETVVGIRGIRNQKGIAPKEALDVLVDGSFPMAMAPVVEKLAIVSLSEGDAEGKTGASLVVKTCKIFVCLKVNVEEEIARLKKDLAYQQQFLAGVRKKLSNENFVAHAPEKVIEMERKKESDALSRIESYEAALKALEG